MKKSMNKAMKDNKGFTLVELIIVVAIIALLIAMIAPNLTSFLGTADETTMKANAKTVYTSANAWLTQQRVDGNGSPFGTAATTLTVKNDGSGWSVTGGSYTNASDYDGFTAILDAGAFSDSVTVTITGSGYAIQSVTWADTASSKGSVSYPSTSD